MSRSQKLKIKNSIFHLQEVHILMVEDWSLLLYSDSVKIPLDKTSGS